MGHGNTWGRNNKDFATDKSIIKGHAKSHDAAKHWLEGRVVEALTGFACVYFIICLFIVDFTSYDSAYNFIMHPFNFILFCLMNIGLTKHGEHGTKVVIHDYVHNATLEFCFSIIVKLIFIVLKLLPILILTKMFFQKI